MGWFLKAHTIKQKPKQLDCGDVATIFDPRCLVLVLRIMRDAYDHRNWTELHAALECFEEVVKAFIVLGNFKLKGVQLMLTSQSEEDNEIADNILLNLFYDENNLDLISAMVRQYQRQSFGYVRNLSFLY